MKKLLYAIFLISTTIIISWCGSESNLNLEFDNFSYNLNFEKEYEETQNIEVSNQLVKNKILKTYQQKSWSDYQSSIIIIKETKSQDLETIVQSEIKKAEENNITILDLNKSNFKCNKQKIDLQTFYFKDWTSETYIWQSYFLKENELYIISISDTNSDNIKSFIKWTKNIKCN